MITRPVPFTFAPSVDNELEYLTAVLSSRSLQGGGVMAKRCEAKMAEASGARHALLTHSCTAALELAMLTLGLRPGDEVIMPSFTFSSTANAVALRNAVPVFIDIRSDTLNLDEALVASAITPKTRAIIAVHYAGIPAEMDAINDIARVHGLTVVEDAAQAYLSCYRGRPAGSLGGIGCFSFHETKNVVSGEGGGFVTNDDGIAERAAILCDKGTNRQAFLQGLVDKYTWVDLGSSYRPSNLVAAFLLAQMEAAPAINAERTGYWEKYYDAFSALEDKGVIRRPIVPAHCTHNGHLFYLLLRDRTSRDGLIRALAADGITAPFHYIPLHDAPAGLTYGRTAGTLDTTSDLASRLIRLPLYRGMGGKIDRVIERVTHHLKA